LNARSNRGAGLLGLRGPTFWGARCRALGVGDTFPFARFSTERLECSLHELLDPTVDARAQALAQQLGEERVVELVERELSRARLAA
jgi:UDP:flavonoid glycosyltransferase YjiC (YdhE family)